MRVSDWEMKIEIDSKRILLVSAVLIFLVIVGTGTAATAKTTAKKTSETTQNPGLLGQFSSGFVCMIMQCGWPSLVLLILPAVAIWIWKKFFSLG